MDKSRQPGINYEGIILAEENFWRDYAVPSDSKIEFNINVEKDNIDDRYVVEIQSTLKLIYNSKEVLKLDNKFVGFFSVVKGKENMNMEDFVKYNAVPLMFPYIREHISSITMKSGIDSVIIPPMNIYALLDE